MRQFTFLTFIFALLFTAACDSPTQAQDGNNGTTAANGSDPVAILKAAHEKFSALESYACKMAVSTVNNGVESAPEVGDFFFSKGKYHLDFSEDETIVDGGRMMTWLKEFGQVEVEPYDPAKDMTLAAVYGLYERNHSAQYLGEENGMHRIRLTAGSGAGGSFGVKEVWIGKESGLIEKYTLNSSSYGTYSYKLNEVSLNAELDPALFVIDEAWIAKVRSGEIPPVTHGHGHGDHDGHDHDGHDHGDHDGHDH